MTLFSEVFIILHQITATIPSSYLSPLFCNPYPFSPPIHLAAPLPPPTPRCRCVGNSLPGVTPAAAEAVLFRAPFGDFQVVLLGHIRPRDLLLRQRHWRRNWLRR